MIEEWRQVKGYEGLYEVSSLGNVRSVDRVIKYSNGTSNHHKGRLLKLGCNHRGYPMAMLSKKNKQRNIAVHRLVAEAFICNPENKPTVNHISGVKSDNRVENLEWNTWEENERHSQETGLKPRGEAHPNSKLNKTKVSEIRRLYPSMTQVELGMKYGVNHRTIGNILNYKTWRHVDDFES